MSGLWSVESDITSLPPFIDIMPLESPTFAIYTTSSTNKDTMAQDPDLSLIVSPFGSSAFSKN